MIEQKLFEVKRLFFDREQVKNKADAGMRRGFAKVGAFIRRRAMSSLRSRKKISEPGRPPSSHLGLVKQNIFFAWQDRPKGVVIGPILLNQKGGKDVLRTLEEGGTRRVVQTMFYAPDGSKHPLAQPEVKNLFYRPRPFMQLALETELPKLKDSLQGCVTV
ncbi:MAG TPA: hypothetical protein VKS79_21215 [Gemmataceae bacterium]|nr:hypothetical protein [Gemmataceae bacterium]